MSRVVQAVLTVCLVVAPQLEAQQAGPIMDGASIQRIVEGFISDCDIDAIPDTWSRQLPRVAFGNLRVKEIIFDASDSWFSMDIIVEGITPIATARWKTIWHKHGLVAGTADFPKREFSRRNDDGEREVISMDITMKAGEATISCYGDKPDVRAAADAHMAAAVASTAEAVDALGVTPTVERLIDIVVANRPLPVADARALSKAERRVLRNAVYARHGRPFKDAGLNAYFQSKPWYQARATFSEAQLTATDQANIRLLPP